MEENKNQQKEKDKDLEELFRETMNIPPISGDMVKDYVGLINKEMAGMTAVWAEYHNIPEVEKNPLIVNHMNTMVNTYTNLLKVADMFNDPKKLEEMINKEMNMPNDKKAMKLKE